MTFIQQTRESYSLWYRILHNWELLCHHFAQLIILSRTLAIKVSNLLERVWEKLISGSKPPMLW